MNLKYKIRVFTLFSVFLALPIYIILHEGGHSLVAIYGGAKITKFSIIGAYMSYEGGSFSLFTLSLLNVAGVLLPLFISNIYVLFYNKESNNIFYKIFSFIINIIPIGSVLAWILVPIFYLYDAAPPYDDVTKFINASKLHPVVVTGVALLLFILSILMCWRKRIVQNYWSTIRSIK